MLETCLRYSWGHLVALIANGLRYAAHALVGFGLVRDRSLTFRRVFGAARLSR